MGRRHTLHTLLGPLLALALAACGGGTTAVDAGADVSHEVAPDTASPEVADTSEAGPEAIADDFCHGLPDGTPCDDGSPCTTDDRCGLGVCKGRAVEGTPACDDGDPCTTGDACHAGACQGAPKDCTHLDAACQIGACDGSGACQATPAPEGTPCDDHDPCTLGDSCAQGACQPGARSPEPACNPILDAFCHGIADGTPCDDGSPCTTDDRCGQGLCQGQPDQEGQACDDGDACTTGDACRVGVCEGAPVACEAPDSPCVASACDPASGACVTHDQPDGLPCQESGSCIAGGVCASGACVGTPAADGTPCWDDDPCTTGDRCVAGACLGEPASGAPCDDGDLCTDSDTCAQGACVGAPRVCPAPTLPCLQAACDPETGGCVDTPVEDGQPCDDDDPCTTGDLCKQGFCVPDATCFCRTAGEGAACDDGDPCTVDDACQGDVCQGAAMDCSGLDTGCALGACDKALGACVAFSRPDGTACDDGLACTTDDACSLGTCEGAQLACPPDATCALSFCDEAAGGCTQEDAADGTPSDDGDPCTPTDVCAAGACVGAGDACAGCQSQDEGSACDDGDPCTQGDTCTADGGTKVCRGAPLDCHDLDDACVVGACQAQQEGELTCVAKPRSDGLPCDDGDPCTHTDACKQGTCMGSALPACVPAVDGCEPADANDVPAGAIPLDPTTGPLTLLGVIDPAGEADWYRVALQAGGWIDLDVGPSCGSALDTRLDLYVGGGSALLASNDDKAPGSTWSAIPHLGVTTTGTYYVRVSAAAASGAGAYLLRVESGDAEPCAQDADCACDLLACDLDGGATGACRPRADIVEEVEPNEASSAALDLGDARRARGNLQTAGDVDWYRVTLPAGQPVSVATLPWCGQITATELTLFNAAWVPLAEDAGSGEQGMARVQGVTTAGGAHYLRVRGQEGATGAYLLQIDDGTCATDADCTCVDQVCSDPVAGGTCAPANPLPEGSSAPFALALDKRQHARIATPFGQAVFELALDEAGSYDIRTLSYCGARLDTYLRVSNAAGTELAQDDDGGEGLFSALSVSVAAPTTLRVTVTAHGASTGAFLLLASPSP